MAAVQQRGRFTKKRITTAIGLKKLFLFLLLFMQLKERFLLFIVSPMALNSERCTLTLKCLFMLSKFRQIANIITVLRLIINTMKYYYTTLHMYTVCVIANNVYITAGKLTHAYFCRLLMVLAAALHSLQVKMNLKTLVLDIVNASQ